MLLEHLLYGLISRASPKLYWFMEDLHEGVPFPDEGALLDIATRLLKLPKHQALSKEPWYKKATLNYHFTWVHFTWARLIWTLQDAHDKTIYFMFIGSPQSSSSSSTSSSSSSTAIHIHEPLSNSYLSTPPGRAERICGHVEETIWRHSESVSSILSRIGFPQSSSVSSTSMQSHKPYINSYPDTIPEKKHATHVDTLGESSTASVGKQRIVAKNASWSMGKEIGRVNRHTRTNALSISCAMNSAINIHGFHDGLSMNWWLCSLESGERPNSSSVGHWQIGLRNICCMTECWLLRYRRCVRCSNIGNVVNFLEAHRIRLDDIHWLFCETV